jgi:hypothetical protein
MRPPTLIGLILIVAGVVILFAGGTFTRRRDVLEVGGLKVSAESKQKISPWIAGGAILAGTVLLISGAGGGTRSRS